jgi:hypothetical protein
MNDQQWEVRVERRDRKIQELEVERSRLFKTIEHLKVHTKQCLDERVKYEKEQALEMQGLRDRNRRLKEIVKELRHEIRKCHQDEAVKRITERFIDIEGEL